MFDEIELLLRYGPAESGPLSAEPCRGKKAMAEVAGVFPGGLLVVTLPDAVYAQIKEDPDCILRLFQDPRFVGVARFTATPRPARPRRLSTPDQRARFRLRPPER
jgi:hypothetical protein